MSHHRPTTHRRFRAPSAGALAFLASAALTPLFAQTTPAATPAPPDSSVVQLKKFVTLGSRFNDRTVTDSPVPIDVLSDADLQQNGYTELGQTLSVLVPSVDFPRPANTDGSDSIRPAAVRGLGPDQTLVLVNGKRYHTSALVNLNGSVGKSDAAVDLNSIPSFALNGVEVLRDGAAAQYGSDAIAGVINLGLRRDLGASFSTTAGATDHGDGAVLEVDGNYGAALGTKGGFVNLTAYFKDRGNTDRGGPDLRQQYFGTTATGALVLPPSSGTAINGTPDPRELTFVRHDAIFGDPVDHERGVFLNADLPLDNGLDVYVFGGVNDRHSISFASWRQPAADTNVRAIYPNGFQPRINPHVLDESFTAGIDGTTEGSKWDLSETYGRNNLWYYTINSLNASYGAASPTRFYDGELAFQQATTNLDITHPFDVGLFAPLNVATGAEFRRELYNISAGDVASYANGGVPILDGPDAGKTPQFGAQGFGGFTPADATSSHRDNIAGYVDVANQLTKKWNIDVAGRVERYTDAGNTATGKIATLYQLVDWLAVRASFSNGFRAPALQQEYFTQTTLLVQTINGVTAPFTTKLFQVNNPAAQVLGATPLKPENSTNFSGGFTFTPFRNFSATLDYYDIGVSNRVVLSSTFTGTAVVNLLTAAGFPGVSSARYFTNGVDTRTQGLDLTTHYTKLFPDGNRLTLTAAYNYNDTVVTYVKPTPANVFAITGTAIFDTQSQLRDTRGIPLDKIVLSQIYDLGKKFTFLLREDWYGKVLSASNTAANNQWLAAKWLVDTEVACHLNQRFTLAVGANNMFNVYPTKFNALNNPSGNALYSSFSPFGFDGGFYYTRLSYKF